MSNVRETSLEQYIKIKEDPKELCKSQERVYNFIKNNPFCCDKEISIGLEISINSINPRRNELLELGFIKDEGTKKYKGRSVHCWRII